MLGAITNALWVIPNSDMSEDFKVNIVKKMASEYSQCYISRVEVHPNVLPVHLLDNSEGTKTQKT